MKAARIASALLALLALAAVVGSAALVAAAVPRSESEYAWYSLLPVAVGAVVVLCVLVVIALTIALATIGSAALTASPQAPRLLNAIVVTLGILTVVMLAFAVFLLWGGGVRTAFGLLSVVWLGVGALVSAAMMMIAVGFRALLEKYRVADAELAVVI